MTVTTQQTTPRSNDPAPDLERKSTRVQPDAGGVLNIDEEQGLVTAIVSVTAIEDHGKDVIHPGSYEETLNRRRPKVVEHHDWKNPVGRVEEVKELPPGHPDLPKETPDGRPWPKEAGALAATMRYNLKTQAGRDAFENVKFYSESNECEWSIGYRVPRGKSTRSRDGVRQIKAIDLYEISFVLFGMAPGTGTLSVKDEAGRGAVAEAAPGAGAVAEVTPDGGDGGGPDADEEDEPDEDPTMQVDAPDGPGPDGAVQVEDGAQANGRSAEDGALEGDDVDWGELERIAAAVLDRASTAANEARPAGDAPAPDGAQDGAQDVVPAPDGNGQDEDGQDDEGDDTEDDEDEDEGDELAPVADDEKALAAQPVFDNEIKRAFSPGKRRELAKSGVALPDGSYPIANVADLRNAIKAFGRAGNPARVKAHIIRRAKALGRTDLLPDGWGRGKAEKKDTDVTTALDALAARQEEKIAHISLDRSPRKNWVEATGQLPAYIQHIAHDLHTEEGMPLSKAIPIAIAAVKRWAAGGGDVRPETRAKAAKAVAEWEALKARAHAKSDPGRYAPQEGETVEVVESADSYPHLPGTFEEIRAQLFKSLTGRAGIDGDTLVTIDATWNDRTIATWFPRGAPGAARSYEIPYRFDGEGKLWIGEPVEVKMAVAADDLEAAPFPHPAALESLAEELKTYLLHEGKAGRVLSASNARHLRGAVEQLVAVLHAAGIDITERSQELEVEEGEPIPAPESTAPSAQPESTMVKVDPMLRAKALQAFAAARD